MTTKSRRFILTDVFLLVMAILPLLVGIVLRVLTKPMSDGIEITGALIYWQTDYGNAVFDFILTEAQVNSWLVILTLLFVCLYLTHGIAATPVTKRQIIAEWIVEQVDNLIHTNMGEYFKSFAPFIAGMMALSALSSLLALLGLFAPTSDINVTAGWAVLVFFLITYYKMKCGPLHYIKSFGDPVAFLFPLNVISEVATPVSMAFRHYGNILSGAVISVLVATGLQGASSLLFGWLPEFFNGFAPLQIGIPAILSLYFDLFSSALQAFIFAMLTMLYVAGAFAQDDYEKMKLKKQQKRRNVQ